MYTEEQANNRRTNRIIFFQGSLKTLAQVSEITGLDKSTIRYRLKRGLVIYIKATKTGC